MSLEGIINFFNPKKKAWWRRDEWVYQKMYPVFEIIQENDGCSWDVELYSVVHYKHKHSCEDRIKIERDLISRKTVFEHPDESLDSENIEHVKIYEGPKYE